MKRKGLTGRVKAAQRSLAHRGREKRALGALEKDGTPKVPTNPLDPSNIAKETLDTKWMQQETIKKLLQAETRKIKSQFKRQREALDWDPELTGVQVTELQNKLKEQEQEAVRKIGEIAASIEVANIREDVKAQYIKNFISWVMGHGTDLEVLVTPWGRKFADMSNNELRDFVALYPRMRNEFICDLAELRFRIPDTLQEWMIYYKYFINPINDEAIRRRIAVDNGFDPADPDSIALHPKETLDWVHGHMSEFINTDFLDDWAVFHPEEYKDYGNDQVKMAKDMKRRTYQWFGPLEEYKSSTDKHRDIDETIEEVGYHLPPVGDESPYHKQLRLGRRALMNQPEVMLSEEEEELIQ